MIINAVSNRRLRLYFAAALACILLPVLGLVLFYDNELAPQGLLSRELNRSEVYGVWQQRLATIPQVQQASDQASLTEWQNLSQTTKNWLQAEPVTTTTTTTTTTTIDDSTITPNRHFNSSVKGVASAIYSPTLRKLHTEPKKKTLSDPQPLNLKKTLFNDYVKRKKKKRHKTVPKYNFVLALNYWDQQTSALRNLLSLQCWTGHFRTPHESVFVVEPFVINSRFGALPTTDDERQHQIMFRDMFDIAQWKESYLAHSYGRSFAHLAPWSEFVAKASKKVILVTISYTRFGRNCSHEFVRDHRDQCNGFLNKYKFQVVREVCVDIQDLTTREFDEKILGKLHAEFLYQHGMTIIFNEWRGIDDDRIILTDSQCGNGIGFVQGALNLRTSPRVINDMKKYIRTYYGEEQVYTALVVRLEKLIINSEEGSELSNVKTCLSKIFKHWSQFRQNFGLKFTFVAMDYGKFGSVLFSLSYASKITSEISESVENFFRNVYGKHMTLRKWEESFENVTNVTNSGYIALMQSTIAARAKCIVLAGGGTFQDHILHLYKQIPRSNQCYLQLSNKCHVSHSSIPKPKAPSINPIFES